MKYAALLLTSLLLRAQSPANFPNGRFYAPYILIRPATDLARLSRDSGVRYFTLAFILGGDDCRASWGSRTPLEQETAIGPAIEALRAQGGDVLISFGGEAGRELALSCPTADALRAQYQAVIDKYKITALDMDIEGGSLSNTEANDRRNTALAAIQAANPALQIAYTLPVSPDGLTKRGLDLLNNAMQRGVRVAVVNLMTMDYGASADPNAMGKHAVTAVSAITAQLLDNGIRARLGIIPMIGRNDVKPEVFTADDARQVITWAQPNPVVIRMSMWSVTRDNQCAAASAPGTGNGCSGVDQQPWEFSNILGQFH